MVWNIYVVGNMKTFFSVFTGLQMLFNPLNHTAWASGAWGGSLIATGLIASLVGLVVMSLVNSRFLIHHVMIMAVAYAVMFGVTVKVNITNVYNGQSQIVSGIPVGLAVPASVISGLFYIFAEQIGQADQRVNTNDTYLFSTANPNSVYGFDGPLALMYNLRGIYSTFSMTDPRLSESIASYVGQCYAPFNIDMARMAKSGNLADLLFNNPPPDPHLPVTLYTNGGDQTVPSYPTTCGAAQPILQQAWNNFEGGNVPKAFESFQNLLAKQMSNSTVPTVTPAEANSLIGSVLDGTANSGFDFMNNMILNCAVQVGADHFYDLYSSNNSAPMSSYCSTKATAFGRSVTLNATSASLFNMNMVPMMAVLQFLFFAGAPIIAFVMILMGPAGFGKYLSYIIFGFSTMMWIPVSQIISDYSEDQMRHSMKQMLASMNGDPITASENIPIILEHAMRNVAMADKMLALTPVVTLALLGLGGAYALTRLGQDNSSEGSAADAIGEAAPMPGNDSLQNGIAERQIVSTGVSSFFGAGFGAGEVLPAAANITVNGSSSMSSAAQAAEAASMSFAQQATTARIAEARSVASVLHGVDKSKSSYLQNDTAASLQFENSRKALGELISATKLGYDKSAEFAAALKGELGPKGLLGEISKSDVVNAFKAIGLGASGYIQDAGKIADKLNTSAGKEAINTLTSGTTATLASRVASGMQNTDMQKTAASINRSAARAESLSRQAVAARQRAETLSRIANSMQSSAAGVTWDTQSMLSAMASYDENKGANEPDAVLASYENANINGLGAMWDANYQASKRVVKSDNAAAALANLRTYNQAMLTSPVKAGDFLRDTLRQFGQFVSPPSVGGAVQGEMKGVAAKTGPTSAVGAAMGQADALFGAADRGTGTAPGTTPAEMAKTAATQYGDYLGAETAFADGFNPYAADDPEQVKKQASAWKKTIGDEPTPPPSYGKVSTHVNGVLQGSKPVQAANWMQNNQNIVQYGLGGLVVGGAVASGFGTYAFSRWLGSRAAGSAAEPVTARVLPPDNPTLPPSSGAGGGDVPRLPPPDSPVPPPSGQGPTTIGPDAGGKMPDPMQALEGEVQGFIDGSPAAEAAAGDIADAAADAAADAG